MTLRFPGDVTGSHIFQVPRIKILRSVNKSVLHGAIIVGVAVHIIIQRAFYHAEHVRFGELAGDLIYWPSVICAELDITPLSSDITSQQLDITSLN